MDDFFFESEAHQAEKEIWVLPEVIASSVVLPVILAIAFVGVVFNLTCEMVVNVYHWLRPQTTAPPIKLSFKEKRTIARGWDKPSL